MTFIAFILYSNLLLGNVNILLLVEIYFQAELARNCSEFVENRLSTKHVGTETNFDEEFPYLAAILAVEDIEDANYDYICAGAIVSKFHSLTACHCIDYLKNHAKITIKVRAGSVSWEQGGSLHEVKDIIRNEHYNQHYYDNDVAITTVKPAFSTNGFIRFAGLNYKLHDGSPVNVISWCFINSSKLFSPNGYFASKLLTGMVNTINTTICARMINEYLRKADPDVPHQNELSYTQFCTEPVQTEMGACVYDFGGLAVQNGVLVGIVPIKERSVCGTKEYPEVYTNLGSLHEWLLNATNVVDIEMQINLD